MTGILHIKRCFTGRLWINLFSGFLAIGIRNKKISRAVILWKLHYDEHYGFYRPAKGVKK